VHAQRSPIRGLTEISHYVPNASLDNREPGQEMVAALAVRTLLRLGDPTCLPDSQLNCCSNPTLVEASRSTEGLRQGKVISTRNGMFRPCGQLSEVVHPPYVASSPRGGVGTSVNRPRMDENVEAHWTRNFVHTLRLWTNQLDDQRSGSPPPLPAPCRRNSSAAGSGILPVRQTLRANSNLRSPLQSSVSSVRAFADHM
jgi:hypothetical protein